MLLGTLVLLELFTFRDYFTGDAIPPWDFLGGYNTDAYYWWAHGSMLSPVQWVPGNWMGYPAAATPQNSSWYLPVGIVANLVPFTLRASAVLAALHVAAGSVGAHVLLRRLGNGFWAALLGSTAWFFAAGYYSNASHVDIARAYAWLPWVLLVLKPGWQWRTWWGPIVGVLVLWQAATGMYPGIFVATGYVGIVWIAFWQMRLRPGLRDHLVPLAGASVLALLLCAPRMLTYYALGSASRGPVADVSQFDWRMLATLLYDYTGDSLPNDLTMRSFFLPATVLLLLFFARRGVGTSAGLALLLPAVVLGVPALPWFGAVQHLPGMSLSRFSMSDFKPFILLGAVIIASAAWNGLLERRRAPTRGLTRAELVRLAAAVLGSALLFLIGYLSGVPAPSWLVQSALLVAGVVALTQLLLLRARNAGVAAVATGALAVVLTAASGLVWAYSAVQPWHSPRVDSEQVVLHGTVSSFIDDARPSGELRERPDREPAPRPLTALALTENAFNHVSYDNTLAVGGLTNLRGLPTQQLLNAAMLKPGTGRGVAAFLALAGTGVSSGTGAPTAGQLAACGTQGDCGPARLSPVSYSPGHFRYQVNSGASAVVTLNEAYYRGWEALVCSSRSQCSATSVRGSEQGLVQVRVPAGSSSLRLDYATPALPAALAMFWLAVLAVLGWAGFWGFSAYRRRETGAHAAHDPVERPEQVHHGSAEPALAGD